MNHRTAVRVFSSTLLAALTFACSSDNIPAVGPSTGILQVTPLFAGFLPGATKQLTATFDGAAVPVTWATTDPAVATVSADGLVTGVASGSASITASMSSDPTQMRSASITVLAVPKLTSGVGVTVSSGTRARHEGLLYQITVPSGATGLTVTFTGGTGDGDIDHAALSPHRTLMRSTLSRRAPFNQHKTARTHSSSPMGPTLVDH